MNHAPIHSRLVALNAKLDQIEFARPQHNEDEPSALSRVGRAGLAVGGAAALGLGASYLRGRMALRGSGLAAPSGWRGAANVAKLGARKFGSDASGAVGAAKTAVGAVGDYFKRKASPGSSPRWSV